jgi:hypothetical protein
MRWSNINCFYVYLLTSGVSQIQSPDLVGNQMHICANRTSNKASNKVSDVSFRRWTNHPWHIITYFTKSPSDMPASTYTTAYSAAHVRARTAELKNCQLMSLGCESAVPADSCIRQQLCMTSCKHRLLLLLLLLLLLFTLAPCPAPSASHQHLPGASCCCCCA